MARRSTPPPSKQPANLTPDQKRAAISLLQRQIEKLRNFEIDSVNEPNDPDQCSEPGD
jgi:hypothetical protein